MLKRVNRCSGSSVHFHSSSCRLFLRQKKLPENEVLGRAAIPRQKEEVKKDLKVTSPKEKTSDLHAPRNDLGVQLLSRKLHSQIFRNISFPSPDPTYAQIAREHLETHGLDPSQGSVLPNLGFDIPALQGNTLDEHFHRVGLDASHPWLDLAKTLADAQVTPKPEHWDIQPGWTKYDYQPDGSSSWVHVEYPMHEGQPENMLVFDVETMPKYSQYPVMACALSRNGWYAWISPWLLGTSTDPKHLIPLGDPSIPRVIVGHNVSYDRARIFEEYSLEGTQNRFIDTMSLHVAVKGISSHQRPAWNKYRKETREQKEEAREQKEEAFEAVVDLIREGNDISQILLDDSQVAEAEADMSSKRWEDLTSANSLADVAKLHCEIDMDKEIRNDFMTSIPERILADIQDYLTYCATDVQVTHAVFAKVLPQFLTACPHPVSFAGVLTMGSSFLTVDEAWEAYLENAERTYRELEDKVKKRLLHLAEQAKEMAVEDRWKDDVWLSQLDWTPKVVKQSRGVYPDQTPEPEPVKSVEPELPTPSSAPIKALAQPTWYGQFLKDGPLSAPVINRTLPLLLNTSFQGNPLHYDKFILGWHYLSDGQMIRLPTSKSTKTLSVLSLQHGVSAIKSGQISTRDLELALAIAEGDRSPEIADRVVSLANRTWEEADATKITDDPWLSQLDWKLKKPAILQPSMAEQPEPKKMKAVKAPKPPKAPPVFWPRWYWDLTKPRKDMPPGTLDLSVRSRVAPILLRLSWLGWPLYHSREYGWTFCVSRSAQFQTRSTELDFYHPDDEALKNMSETGGFVFYKLPHKDGDKANVGSPFGKSFVKFAQDRTLTSPGDEAKEALDMNAQCSYWISARDRIMNQMVVWQDEQHTVDAGATPGGSDGQKEKKQGIILPQMITMGTVTRRAIEKTWLTASNAKKNRVGSELKAMVRAPKGYSIVGADVDSEELWISSVMGDAQFGLHGATAIGWMTLEGTKAAGTDLHSKTASILGISRDQAKVFNYSRIYGAGMRHAVLLLLQSNAGMLPEQAQKLAEQLYASTKGKNTHRTDWFRRKFWFGGTESFVFNKLEDVALSDKPQTPALGCGITHALSKEYLPAGFGTDYMTSRINWVVQSSGVDYLHLLIVSMEHLMAKYNIKARFLISVHDEIRYLVADEDRYRAALALQIANLWTRSLFAYKLGMDDLPQGVAFFSSVDVDKVLRKEVDMPCVTPSHPIAIPPGESLNIQNVLEKTNGGSLWKDGRRMIEDEGKEWKGNLDGYRQADCLIHRASNAAWLRAQATLEVSEIKLLAQREPGFKGGEGQSDPKTRARRRKKKAIGDGEGVDWTNAVEDAMKSETWS